MNSILDNGKKGAQNNSRERENFEATRIYRDLGTRVRAERDRINRTQSSSSQRRGYERSSMERSSLSRYDSTRGSSATRNESARSSSARPNSTMNGQPRYNSPRSKSSIYEERRANSIRYGEQRNGQNPNNIKRKVKKQTPIQKLGSFIGKTLAVISTTILAIFLALVLMIFLICHGPSNKATELFTTTFLETGQMKFIVSIFLSDAKVKEIVARNSMSEMTAEVDTDLITIAEDNKDSQDIELVQIPGSTFHAKMLIIKDPSRVKLATTYPWGEYGVELDKLVTKSGAVAGVNGGLYVSDSNKGGKPLGLVVCDGQIQYNNPSGYAGLYLIGFDESNILRIISLEGMNASQIEKLVKDEKIRDAVVFQEESSDKNNHFVKLVINGEAREMNGSGSGANPRTVIGQRKDGAVLLLVTDGRGASGHLGATASDLIDIMMEYGAVNAANLDGGSSSSMYYNNQYEMTSVTLYYSNSSWKLPTAFVVK